VLPYHLRCRKRQLIDWLRTLLARLITRHGVGPRNLQIRAWAWLAAETDDLAEKRRCLEAIMALDWAQAALTGVWHRWPRER
jgi:hypothetical protein